MDIALTAQLFQNFTAQPSKQSTATIADDIRSLLGLASGALMLAGEAFKQAKGNLSRARFGDWLDKNGFVSADANKLIKLFEHFGDAFDDLSTINPLSLIRLVVPSAEDAREALLEMVEEYREINEIVTSQEVETVRKVHSPQQTKRAATKEDESNATIEMVGNQPGGTGILRFSVKNHELANQLDTEWKQSGCSPDKWMQFMLASTHKIQEIAQVVLGREIVHVSELSQLDVVIDFSQSNNKFVGVELKIDDFGQVLPSEIVDNLNKLRDLDENIARYTAAMENNPLGTNPMFLRISREQRTKVLSQLEILAAEYQLDVESLIWRQPQELAHC